MSKAKWGVGVSVFLAIAIQFIPVPDTWRWGITILAAIGLVIFVIGWLVSKNRPEQSESISRTISGSNVASAGRDVHQTIYHGLQPDDKKKEIAERLGEFLAEGEHWKSVCKNPKGDIFPGDRMVEWARKLEWYVSSKLGQSYLARLTSSTGITDFPVGVPEQFRGNWIYINVRCVRLYEFIKELTGIYPVGEEPPPKKQSIATYDRFAELVKHGDAMMDRLRGKNAQLIEGEFEQWDAELIRLARAAAASSNATGSEMVQ